MVVEKDVIDDDDLRPPITMMSPDISTSPDLLSSDSGFRTDDGYKNTFDESCTLFSETTDIPGDGEDEIDSDNVMSIKDERDIYSEDEIVSDKNNSKRFK